MQVLDLRGRLLRWDASVWLPTRDRPTEGEQSSFMEARESTVLARQEHALPPPSLASPVCTYMCIILETLKTTMEYILILEVFSLNN